MAGAFVEALKGHAAGFGIGKAADLRGAKVLVEYFDVPGGSEQPKVWVSARELRAVSLPAQTRVFRLATDGIRWQVGRVIEGTGDPLLVKFPNERPSNFPLEKLYVRWKQPVDNPVAFLAAEVTETPQFAEARSKFRRALSLQRIACLGMNGLLSARVELEGYQFDVVRRVLQDPVQRYLLADEVGLGKTIEAGALIRQYFLDEPEAANAVVIVPAPLVEQWRNELTSRFALGTALDNDLHVLSADQLEDIERCLRGTGMLVVDEAHHLSRASGAHTNHLYDLLRVEARNIPRLLLLSATPVLADEAGFLRILHLLDPIVFPFGDLDGFRARIIARQAVAETVASLVPENVLVLEGHLDRVAQSFPTDAVLMGQVDALRSLLARFPEEDDADLEDHLKRLRAYISEAYRLHRRILRNRRKAVPWATPNRSGLEKWVFDAPNSGRNAELIDALRGEFGNAEPASVRPLLKSVFGIALGPAGPDSWGDVARAATMVGQAVVELVGGYVQRFQRIPPDLDARIQATAEGLKRLLTQQLQAMVFCDLPETADRVFEVLKQALSHKVARQGADGADGAVNRNEPFGPTTCRVLVCDRHAEEGLNLHGGRKVLVHFDLPASPNRIEQRIGRLDRYGKGDAVRSVALVCANNPAERAWVECLDRGFGVFSESIASLQYLVDEVMHELPERWLADGSHAFLQVADELSGSDGRVARERRRIDQQDALDSLSHVGDKAFEHLEDVDSEWSVFRDAVDAFSKGTLQFTEWSERWPSPLPPGERVFRLRYSYNQQHDTLLTMGEFLEYF